MAKRGPRPFCEDEPPHLVSSPGKRALEACLLCCQERPRYIAVGHCGHTEVCWICAVRLRALHRDLQCPVCKVTLPEVALVLEPSPDTLPSPETSRPPGGAHAGGKAKVGLAAGNGGVEAPELSRFGIICSSQEIKTEVERLFEYACWIDGCLEKRSFKTLSALEEHVQSDHGVQFCSTCLRTRPVFLREQFVYHPKDMDRHCREGDTALLLGRNRAPTPAHAECKFCDRSFYCQDNLLEHMNKHHHLCGLCQRLGRRSEYYDDVEQLSLHYDEEHFVCRHEECMKGPFRLVAFTNEDELYIHELAAHSARGKGSQKSKKQGARITIQMGAASYADQEPRRPTTNQPRNASSSVTAAAAVRLNVDEGHVRFMRTRGRTFKASEQDVEPPWKLVDDEFTDRYPSRSSKPCNWTKRNPTSGSVVPSAKPVAQGRLGREMGTKPTKAQIEGVSEIAAHGVLARLLSVALDQIKDAGLNAASTFDAAEYKLRNKQFKNDLISVLGEAQLVEFKELSSAFRRSCAGSAETDIEAGKLNGPIEIYAKRICDVFVTVREVAGHSATSRLLCELVLLLPERALRHALHDQLLALCEAESKAVAAAVTKVGTTAGASDAILSQSLDALPVSVGFKKAGDRQPHFLTTLDAVLGTIAEGDRSLQKHIALPIDPAKLRASVLTLDSYQAESLALLQHHLGGTVSSSTSATTRPLDFTSAERLLALRPLLALKLNGGNGSGTEKAWREWKVVAASTLYAFPPEERACLQMYIRQCLRHLADGCHSHRAMKANVAAKLRADPCIDEAFPSLQPTAAQSRDIVDSRLARECEDKAPSPSSQAGRKGRKRGQVIQAWG